MIIDCISDLHGSYPEMMGGDLLIVAGDLTARDMAHQHSDFCEWLDTQPYMKKIVIAGNHDGHLFSEEINCLKGCEYLQDSGTEFEGFKIWGSPWTPEFCNWHFMKSREELRSFWKIIPKDTDILVTHGPPYGVLDTIRDELRQFHEGFETHGGCKGLKKRVDIIKPKLHVFGHIHEGYGTHKKRWFPKLESMKEGEWTEAKDTIYVNAAHMDRDYRPVNPPIRILLEPKRS